MAGSFTPATGADFYYRGTTDGGAPSAGDFVLGDWVETPTGIMVCQVGGSPGVWGDMASTEAGALVSNTAYDATTWDGVTTIAPSKNAVRDKIESLSGATVPLANATAQTSNYTAVHGDLVLCDASGGAFTVTLPAVALGRTVTVKKTDSSLNAITVSPASGTVDGSASRKIASQYQSADFISDGVNWFVAMSYNPINRIDLTAAEMNNIAGAPDLNNSQVSDTNFRVPVWRLDQASAEGVGGVVGPLPSYWNTFDLKVIHTIAGAGITGDVQWQGRYNFFAPGGTEGNTLGATVNVTAPAQDNLIETTLIAGIAVVQNQLLRVRVDRNAAAGADTLNGDAGVVGLVLGKAS